MSVYKLKPTDKQFVQEFKAKPIGLHTPGLQRILNLFRGESMSGKYVLVCTKPHQQWMLAELPSRRGQPLKVHHNQVFQSIEQAEWEVFKLRWHKYTGERLDD